MIDKSNYKQIKKGDVFRITSTKQLKDAYRVFRKRYSNVGNDQMFGYITMGSISTYIKSTKVVTKGRIWYRQKIKDNELNRSVPTKYTGRWGVSGALMPSSKKPLTCFVIDIIKDSTVELDVIKVKELSSGKEAYLRNLVVQELMGQK